MSEASQEVRVVIIPNRLEYCALHKAPAHLNTKDAHFFSTDKTLLFYSFFNTDFGPLSLGHLYRFCQSLRMKLDDARKSNKVIIYYSSTHPYRMANSVYLIASFALLYLNNNSSIMDAEQQLLGASKRLQRFNNAEEAFAPFSKIQLPPFHDASPLPCSYHLSVLDCLRGLQKSKYLGFLNFDNFDVEEYEYYEKVENGDLNWIFPGKFLAFAGPHENKSHDPMYPQSVPEDYIPYFKNKNVSLIVRLNKKYYDERRFTRTGFEHADIYFLDGSNPPLNLLQKFLDLCERTPGGVAVHCKAGLGRTGTCIGCYAMKHYGYTAAEAIGWMRICRPGSVIGPQQHFMEEMEKPMWEAGEMFRNRYGNILYPLANFPGDASNDNDVLSSKPNRASSAASSGIQNGNRTLVSTPISREHVPRQGNNNISPKESKNAMEIESHPFFSTEESETSNDPNNRSQGDILRLHKSPIMMQRRNQTESHMHVAPMSLSNQADDADFENENSSSVDQISSKGGIASLSLSTSSASSTTTSNSSSMSNTATRLGFSFGISSPVRKSISSKSSLISATSNSSATRNISASADSNSNSSVGSANGATQSNGNQSNKTSPSDIVKNLRAGVMRRFSAR